MMCDVLPAICLNCVLQSSCIDLSQLHSLVSCRIETLELLCLSTGLRMNTLDVDLENSLVQCKSAVCPESKQLSRARVYVPLIKALTSHIKDRLPEVFAAFQAWIQESFHHHRNK